MQISDNAQWEVSFFQDDLIAAQSMAELQAAKARFSEDVRIKAMDMWKADGQYSAFESKVEALKQKDERLKAFV
jgi:hypothetical protein